ncbi:MAG: tail fiber domain-containing protein [Pseudonocardiaceae bacterium]
MTSHIQDGERVEWNAAGPSSLIDPIGTGPINSFEVLAKLGALPVATWRYRWESAGVRHLGPMAQDWHATFGLGKGDTRIPMVDAHGVLVQGEPQSRSCWLGSGCRPRMVGSGCGLCLICRMVAAILVWPAWRISPTVKLCSVTMMRGRDAVRTREAPRDR